VNNIGIVERIQELTQQSSNPIDILNSQVNPSKPEEKLLSILSASKDIKTDVCIVGLTIGDLIYDTLRLDPNVIQATDFARAEDLGNVFKFSVYADKLKELPESTFEGHIDNLKGYVGERFVAQQLQSAGMEVEFPNDSNQTGYDLLVNGDTFQVKCVADKSSILEHLDKNPDVPVFVNEEIISSLDGVPNVYPVEGFSLQTIENSTREAFGLGDEVLDFEIPFIALGVAIGKNAYMMWNRETDLKHGAINVAYDVVGGWVGGEIGASSLAFFGSLLAPYAVVVGGLVGAASGSMYGRRLFSKAKRFVHTRKEEELAEKTLKEFISKSYDSSQNSREIFEKKVQELIFNLSQKGDSIGFLTKYAKRRITSERNYFKDKIRTLSVARKNPRVLAAESEDILIAGLNSISLSLRAKVHPHSVKRAMDNLIESLKVLEEKREKLL